MQYKRIMIFGRPGSGKSTFASKLARASGYPLHHIDKLFFLPGWGMRSFDELESILQPIVAGDEWIIDGNVLDCLESRYARAELALYFHYPRYRCYWRILKRFFYKDPQIDDRAPECPETLWLKLLRFIWFFESLAAPHIERLRVKYPQVRLVEVTSDADLQRVLHNVVQNRKSC